MKLKHKQEFKPAQWFKNKYCVSSSSLRLWDSKGKIQSIRCPGGKRFYNTHSVDELLGIEHNGNNNDDSQNTEKKSYIYARVSSKKQETDLERQVSILSEAYPNHKVIKDIGSGLNFKRQGLCSLLERVYEGNVTEIVVLHKDRLSRFASGLLEHLFEKTGVKFVVHSPSQDLSDFCDLADDLLAVTTFFVASNNGKRSAQHRRMRKEKIRDSGEKNAGIEITKNDTNTFGK